MREVGKLMTKAHKELTHSNFEKAITYYTKCIELDPLQLDAFYNRAYSYYKLEKYEQACKDWRYLYLLGQTEGERLYRGNCLND